MLARACVGDEPTVIIVLPADLLFFSDTYLLLRRAKLRYYPLPSSAALRSSQQRRSPQPLQPPYTNELRLIKHAPRSRRGALLPAQRYAADAGHALQALKHLLQIELGINHYLLFCGRNAFQFACDCIRQCGMPGEHFFKKDLSQAAQ